MTIEQKPLKGAEVKVEAASVESEMLFAELSADELVAVAGGGDVRSHTPNTWEG